MVRHILGLAVLLLVVLVSAPACGTKTESTAKKSTVVDPDAGQKPSLQGGGGKSG